MKKILILFLLVCISSKMYAQKKEFVIGTMLDYRTPIGDSLLIELEKEVSRVAGEDAVILIPEKYLKVNGFSIQKATSDYLQLLKGPVDAILIIGPIGELAVKDINDFAKPTIVFGTYNEGKPIREKPVGDNLTYIVDRPHFGHDLSILHGLTNFSCVGIAIERPYAEALEITPVLDDIVSGLDARYHLITFDNLTDVQSNLDGIDALYLAGGQLSQEALVRDLAGVLIKKKIPSMSTGGIIHLEHGFLCTTVPRGNFDQMIRNISLSVDRYIQNEPLPKESIQMDYEPRLTVNFNVAEVVEVSIPYSSVDDTDYIGNANRLAPEETFSLESFLNTALGKNLVFKGEKKEVLLKSQDVKIAKSNYLPTLNAGSSLEYVSPEFAEVTFGQNAEYQTVGNLTIGQTLFSPQANANIEIEKNLLGIEKQKLSTKELDLVLEASTAYFNTLLAKSEVDIQKGNLQLTKTNCEIAKQNYESGQSDRSDLLRLESRLALDKQRMITAINTLEQALNQLNRLVNNPLGKKIDIENLTVDNGFFQGFTYEEFEQLLDSDGPRERFVLFLTEESRNNSPELKTLAHLDKVTERQMRLFGTQRTLPTIGLQASYINFLDRRGAGSQIEGLNLPNDYYTVGVGISIPIFSGNRNNISHQRAKIRKEQIGLETQNAVQSLETGVRNITLEVINQMATIKLARETERAAGEALELIQDAYSNGAVSVVQLFDVQNTYLQAQISKIQADYGYLMSVANLERTIAHYAVLNSEEANQGLKQRFLTFQK